MPEMGTSGLMSGDGKRGGRIGVRSRAHPRLYRRPLDKAQSVE
jgi:hypothetical protein